MKSVFTSLSPNTERDDILLAFRLLFSPERWRKGEAAEKLCREFKKWLSITHGYAFASGRGALYALLRAGGVKEGDEVLIQAYTCVAVPDAVLWTGAVPVYVDVNEECTMSPVDLRKKITKKSKAIVVQHTFGRAAHMEKILEIAKEHKLFVVEDCAHVMGGTYQGKTLGTLGDGAIWSFGRDKALSSVFGGMATTDDPKVGRRLGGIHASLSYPPRRWIFQQLMHPLVLAAAKATYDIAGLGKILLELSKRLRVISKAVYPKEKKGGKPRFVSWRMPNALATLALHQFENRERFAAHRKRIETLYVEILGNTKHITLPKVGKGDVPLRYTIRVKNPKGVIEAAKRNKMELGDWYAYPIAPGGVAYGKIGYEKGSCPMAEELAEESLNLPTHIQLSEEDAIRVAGTVRAYVTRRSSN